MRSQGKALVLGDDTRSFLAIVRSLGRAGIEVHAAPADFTAPALRSKYITAAHRLPPYLGDGAEWCAGVTELLRCQAFDLVIPCDERTLLPFDRHRAAFKDLARLAIPSPESIEILFDKQRTRDLAASLDVPVARGRLVGPDDDAAALIAEFGLPLVIKPCASFRLEALYTRGRAEICETAAELDAALARRGGSPHLIEAYFPGHGAGVSILAHRGRVLQAFQHARARERGGAGFYRVSAPLSPDLLAAVERMAGALRFTGVAMVEFKIDPRTGGWILLEVNARPWGSMPLPLALGVNFPSLWYRLLVAGEERPPRAYRPGVYARNLLPDARQILAEARDLRRTPAAMVVHLLAAGAQFGRLALGREHLDVLVADDPAPGFSELSQAASGIAARLVERVPGSRLALSRREQGRVRRLMRQSRGGTASIAMLCRGNICRSPLAAELLRRHLSGRFPQLRILAAGLMPREGVASAPVAVAAARNLGVDLAAHRSVHFSERDAAETTLAVIFDERNRDDLSARYPALAERTVMLGSFLESSEGPREIADPDGGDLATFERTYARIATAVSALAAVIAAVLSA